MSLKFRSKYEKKIWENLGDLQEQVEYEPQSPVVRYFMPHTYIPDFKLPNGILVEAKGYFRPRDRSKMRAIKKQCPDLDIRFLFADANKRLTKSTNSMMYWQWAEKHGYEWAEGDRIPMEWFYEG